jgi:hypothetical protein
MTLHEDPKIPPARRNPLGPHHSHKFLDVAVDMGLKAGDFIGEDVAATT